MEPARPTADSRVMLLIDGQQLRREAVALLIRPWAENAGIWLEELPLVSSHPDERAGTMGVDVHQPGRPAGHRRRTTE